MADELTLGFSFSFSKNGFLYEKIKSALLDSVAGDEAQHGKVLVGTSESAIPLGALDSLGWSLFFNLDDTNYFEIRSATGAGNDIIRVPNSTFAFFHFGSDISAPFWIANTDAVEVEYFITEL